MRRSEPGEDTTRLTATVTRSLRSLEGAELVLHVVLEKSVARFPLPATGRVVVGRSAEADLRIDDPSVSRRHCVIDVGPPLRIENLGASNGVLVSGRRLAEGATAPLEPGAVLEVGHVMIVVQRAISAPRPRRVWSHGYFEGRVEDECARAVRSGSSFAVLRLHVDTGPMERERPERERGSRTLEESGPERERESVEAVVSSELRATDVLATYGPGELEALLVDATPPEAERRTQAIVTALAQRRGAARTGVACFPRDASTPDALLAKACDALRPAPALGSAPVASRTFGNTLRQLDGVLGRIARGNIHVLVTGETGVGKELVAERVHALSSRASRPLVRVNCAAFSETLLASELFGHERGAFTGADRAKPGLLETADGGTLLLDEVGELPPSIQPKLLRVLEDKVVIRVGALKGRPVDVRFVAATNRDLESDVAAGRFRSDLYFRLNGFHLHLPPLRERADEIPEIARGLLERAAREAGLPSTPPFASEALDALVRYGWPGNVRELRNVIDRAVLLCASGAITLEHLPLEKMRHVVVPGPTSPPLPEAPAPTDPLQAAFDARERQRVTEALAQCGGNQTRAARMLGISRGTLMARIQAFGLTRPRKAH
jgi:DNA-binding NtrC family response regulator